MKLQLIQAPNMRKAMMRIQEELGPNALIYRTRNNVGGIEVLAGIPSELDNFDELTGDAELHDAEHTAQNSGLATALEMRLDSLDRGLRALSEKVGIFATTTNNASSVRPIAEKYHHYFKQLGFSDDIINELFEDFIESQTSSDSVSANIQHEILKRIKTTDEDLFEKKSVVALVGPTGVGKTTTIVKISTRFLEKYDAKDIGIISTDVEDLTIKNKLSHYCSLYDIDFAYVNTPDELSVVLYKMAAKKIVLIDTHGVSQRDHVALKSLTSLIEGAGHKISVYLALPCNQQESILNEIVERFTFKRIKGCILTKIDESIKVTPALGVVMKHNLALAYLCNGQDLERDISLPTINAVADSLPIIFHNDVVDVVSKEKNRKSKWMRMIRSLNFIRSMKLFRTFRFGH